jgi:hypothetical protein
MFIDLCLLKRRVVFRYKISNDLLFARLVDKVGATFFDLSTPVTDSLSSNVLVGDKIIVIAIDSNHSAF